MTTLTMKNPQPKAGAMKAEITHENGCLKISVSKLPNGAQSQRIPIQFKAASARLHRDEGAAQAVAIKQPKPKLPGITRKMVRQHLPGLLKERLLEREPTTASDWLLAEWHVARKLKLPTLRLAYFVSETLDTSPRPQPRPARPRSEGQIEET